MSECFYPKNLRCKVCLAEVGKKYYLARINDIKLRHKKYREENKTKETIRHKNFYKKNSEKILCANKKYYSENKCKIRAKHREYYLSTYKNHISKNRNKINTGDRKRRKENINVRIKSILKGRLAYSLRRNSGQKNKTTLEFLGCSIIEFKKYIESKFDNRMSWENHGYYTWHIDHIIPISKFDLTNLEECAKCFHYSNMQPLWWTDNLKKSNHG